MRIIDVATMVERKCACCGKTIMVRAADVKRGWGKFCSKSCKAKQQEARKAFMGATHGRNFHAEQDALDAVEAGWDGHKNWH